MIRADVRPAINAIQTIGLTQREIDTATSRALNHTIGVVRTRSVRSITSQYNVPAKRVRKALKVWRANRSHLSARIDSELKPMTVTRFRSRQVKSGVRVEIRKGHKQVIKSAFKIKSKGGMVFGRGQYSSGKMNWRKQRTRRTGPDLPITPILTTSVAGMFTAPEVVRDITREANQRLPARVSHEIDRILQTRAR